MVKVRKTNRKWLSVDKNKRKIVTNNQTNENLLSMAKLMKNDYQ